MQWKHDQFVKNSDLLIYVLDWSFILYASIFHLYHNNENQLAPAERQIKLELSFKAQQTKFTALKWKTAPDSCLGIFHFGRSPVGTMVIEGFSKNRPTRPCALWIACRNMVQVFLTQAVEVLIYITWTSEKASRQHCVSIILTLLYKQKKTAYVRETMAKYTFFFSNHFGKDNYVINSINFKHFPTIKHH